MSGDLTQHLLVGASLGRSAERGHHVPAPSLAPGAAGDGASAGGGGGGDDSSDPPSRSGLTEHGSATGRSANGRELGGGGGGGGGGGAAVGDAGGGDDADDDAKEEKGEADSPPEVQKPNETNLGQKTISLFGSVVLNVNNLCGPGMLLTPLVFQQAGWALPSVLLIILCVISSFSCICIIQAIRLIPGNQSFEKRIEFSTVVHHYYGHKAYIACQLLYALSLQTLNIASIIACTQVSNRLSCACPVHGCCCCCCAHPCRVACGCGCAYSCACVQVMDQFFVFAFGRSYALQFSPSFGFVSTPSPACLESPWSESGVVLTLGYLVTMATCMPLGFLNLDQNILFQYVSFTIFCLIFSNAAQHTAHCTAQHTSLWHR
jgi:hypothetical protein